MLGEEMRHQTISCQWHFLRCAKKVLHQINKEDRDEFLKLANALIHKAVTKNAYEEYRTKLETICIRANCKSWCNFWHRRRFHFVSAFRGFFLPGVNLAETVQAGMKQQQNHQLLSLVDAAYKDISAWLRQDELYKATLDNCTTEKGWVHNMAQKQADEHRAQQDRVPCYLKDLQKGDPWMEETMIDNFNDFHPEENSGHDFTSTSNRGHGHGWGGCGGRGRGTTSHNQCKTDRAPPKRKRAQAVQPMSSDGASSQAQAIPPMSSEGAPSQAQAIPPNLPHAPPAPLQHPLPPVAPIGMHNVPVPGGQSGHLFGPLVPQNDEDRLLSGQQPAIVMYNRMIQKCFTCEVDFDPNFMCTPHNMVIRSKTRRWRIFNGQKIRCKTYTNAHYCVNNLACVRKQLPGTVKNHMYMGNFYFQSLTPGHKEVPQEYGYWNNILKN